MQLALPRLLQHVVCTGGQNQNMQHQQQCGHTFCFCLTLSSKKRCTVSALVLISVRISTICKIHVDYGQLSSMEDTNRLLLLTLPWITGRAACLFVFVHLQKHYHTISTMRFALSLSLHYIASGETCMHQLAAHQPFCMDLWWATGRSINAHNQSIGKLDPARQSIDFVH